jgi:hypothetical protein
MRIGARISEISTLINDAEERSRSKADAYRGADRAAFGWQCGSELAAEVSELYRERAALSGQIVSLTSHNGKLLLATTGGMFEVVGDELRYITLAVAG